jgi:hypothetical protein
MVTETPSMFVVNQVPSSVLLNCLSLLQAARTMRTKAAKHIIFFIWALLYKYTFKKLIHEKEAVFLRQPLCNNYPY